MKNLNYFPFERNKYFYGKLLSVDDFETEQKYMNNKRRMGNRFLHGCGVISGLNVVQVDDRTFSLEAGLALDYAGREIVVERPVTKKLTEIEGFDSYTEEDEERSSLYLCIEYEEREKEPVYNVAGDIRASLRDGEFNKVAEGYHLFLTNEQPESGMTDLDAYYEERTMVYWGNGVQITQIFPRFLESGQEFGWKLVVENLGEAPLRFSYRLLLDFLECGGQDFINVAFDEEEHEKTGHYELAFRARALSVRNTDGNASVEEDNFTMSLGGRPVYNAKFSGGNTMRILEGGLEEEIKGRYYRETMDKLTKETVRQDIYLAELSVIRAETTYVIDRVRPMPFEQYVYNGVLASLMDRITQHKIDGLEKRMKTWETKGISLKKQSGGRAERPAFQIATGTAVIDLGIGGTAGQKFFSQEITHGLGLGAVTVLLGEAYSLKDDSKILFGDPDVFEDKGLSVKGKFAARVNVAAGTFMIGLALSETTVTRRVKIHWTAMKDNSELRYDREERGLYLKPEMAYLKLRETYYFEPIFTGAAEHGVRFRVKEAEGGAIDENGMYTAPNIPGVYEVIAESTAYPDLRASAFVVVRDI